MAARVLEPGAVQRLVCVAAAQLTPVSMRNALRREILADFCFCFAFAHERGIFWLREVCIKIILPKKVSKNVRGDIVSGGSGKGAFFTQERQWGVWRRYWPPGARGPPVTLFCSRCMSCLRVFCSAVQTKTQFCRHSTCARRCYCLRGGQSTVAPPGRNCPVCTHTHVLSSILEKLFGFLFTV